MKKKIVIINGKIKKFNKKIEIPGDKSCSIRALLFASQCIGESKIFNLLESTDVLDCCNALRTLGVKIIKRKNHYWTYKRTSIKQIRCVTFICKIKGSERLWKNN